MQAFLSSQLEHVTDYVFLNEIMSDIPTATNAIPPHQNNNAGRYRLYTVNPIDNQHHDDFDFKGSYLIHSLAGAFVSRCIYYTDNEKFSIGRNMVISEINNYNEFILPYVYYYLKLNPNLIEAITHGTNIPTISKQDYYNIQIPRIPIIQQYNIINMLNTMNE